MSGGSASAVSENEANYGTNESTPGTAGSTSNGPFRFPKTKKMMMSDWLQESETAEADDDVSANYLRGSRSPPGIATHLLRAAPLSPVKNVCSAKKRWLRQAISEDHTEEERAGLANGGSPGPEAANDYVTPLKKRRLENYKNDMEEEDHQAATTSKAEEAIAPGNLKKKLLHNMALEAKEEVEIAPKEELEEVKVEEDAKAEEDDDAVVQLRKKTVKSSEPKSEVEVKQEDEGVQNEAPEDTQEKKPATRKSKRTAAVSSA